MEKYLSIKEVSKKWGISERRIRILCTEGKIGGAYKTGKTWLIPNDKEKPVDGRKKVVDNTYKFPILMFTKYYFDTEALTEDELALLNAQKEYLTCNHRASFNACKYIISKSNSEHVLVGTYYILGIQAVLLKEYDTFKECKDYLKEKAFMESSHHPDYLLIYYDFNIILGRFLTEFSSATSLFDISKDALNFGTIYKFSMTCALAQRGESVDVLFAESCYRYIKEDGNPVAISYANLLIAFIYQTMGILDKRDSHLKEGIEYIYKYNCYTIVSKLGFLIGEALFVEARRQNEKLADFMYKRMVSDIKNSVPHVNEAVNNSLFKEATIEESHIISLIASGLSNEKISSIIDASIYQVEKMLNDLYVKYNVSNKKELKELIVTSFSTPVEKE